MKFKTTGNCPATEVRSDKLVFQAFGVKICVNSNDFELLIKVREVLPHIVPVGLFFLSEFDTGHFFKVERKSPAGKIYVSRNGEESICFLEEDQMLEYLSSQIRITVAEFAESSVFIHAGAVGWKNAGIIIPGKSYSGKTTLVSELIRRGAEYYSDEYAVIDERGFLNPYPKKLSMRGIIDEYRQVDTSPEAFGAKIGAKTIPVKLVLITQFEEGAVWDPQVLSPGEGIMEILQHTIPIRFKPDFVLNVLKKSFSSAIIAKSKRGEAEISLPLILEYLEAVCK